VAGTMEVDLDCAVCGTSAALTDVDAVMFEHVTEVWSRMHAHTAPERVAWYQAAINAGDE
jgi:hypothetical protein